MIQQADGYDSEISGSGWSNTVGSQQDGQRGGWDECS